MKKFICLLIISFLLFSCEKKEISNLPFEINSNISCDDLYENGYKRTFGVDVVLIGKIMNDTIIHYQVDLPSEKNDIDYNDFEENTIVAVDTFRRATVYDKYLIKDALELNDSIYELVWGNIKKQKRDVCNKGSVSWRNFMIELKKNKAKNYRNTIDTNKYRIFDLEKESQYSIDEFKVVNLVTKDTFNGSVYEQNKKYYFSSTFTLINYE